MKRWLTILGVATLVGVASIHYLENRSAHGAHVPTAGKPRIAKWHDDEAAAMSLTFDDGLQCHADIAAPMLQQFGFRATFYIVPGMARQHPADAPIKDPRLRFGEGALSWDEIRSLHDMGMEIGNHSLTHVFLNHITDDAILDEQINHSADMISQNVGEAPLTFAFPYNEFSPHSKEVVFERHLAIRDNWTDYGGPSFTAEVANALVEKAIHAHSWLVPMIHGIDGGFLPLSSTVMREHLAYIKSHEDEIWVDTYADVARYQMERNGGVLAVEDSVPGELTFSISEKRPISRPVPLTVVLPLPLNENTDEVAARVVATEAPVPFIREADCVLVDLFPNGSPVRVTWH